MNTFPPAMAFTSPAGVTSTRPYASPTPETADATENISRYSGRNPDGSTVMFDAAPPDGSTTPERATTRNCTYEPSFR